MKCKNVERLNMEKIFYVDDDNVKFNELILLLHAVHIYSLDCVYIYV